MRMAIGKVRGAGLSKFKTGPSLPSPNDKNQVRRLERECAVYYMRMAIGRVRGAG
jgi:hypothetical protein